jgi:hypothetical protein
MYSSRPDLDELRVQIEALILRESEDFFHPPTDLAVLHVTIRIACEFLDFLKRTDGTPELGEAEYMAGTIRSGMDQYFTIGRWGAVLRGVELQSGFGRRLPSSFSEMRASYESVFQQLIQCTSSAKGVGLLLSLVQMMLLFMTVYFPSFLGYSGPESSAVNPSV